MFGVNPEAWLALHRQEQDELVRAANAARPPRHLLSPARLLPSPFRLVPRRSPQPSHSPVVAPAPACATC
ncbi:hypothetical protein [Schumannella luteola]